MSASSTSTDEYPVYVGVWTNWSRGQILGSTLTLTRRESDLLVAFTAFFIAFIATRAWRIICFAIHRSGSQKTPQNIVYHQHQAILRNSSTAEGAVELLSSILWANKNSTGRFRPLSTAVIATLCISSFTIAGGFSSYISTAIGDEVLMKSMNCGQVDRNLTANDDPVSVAYTTVQINNAANYAQQCYSSSGGDGNLLGCGRFVKKEIIASVDKKATCPFHTSLCRNGTSNIRIDSGYLSSHDHFGLNSPPDQRVLFRNVYSCAPLVTNGYTSQSNTSFGEATLYHYGNSSGGLGYAYAAKSLQNQYSFYFSSSSLTSYANFEIQANFANVQDGKVTTASVLSPIDSMFREDADIHIYFLSGNGVVFAEILDDPWYRVANVTANASIIGTADGLHTVTRYLTSEPASPLGCASQFQFCNSIPGDRKCGPLASLRDAVAGVVDLFDTNYADLATTNATTRRAALLNYVYQVVGHEESIKDVVYQLGPASLLSQGYLKAGFLSGIEKDQWQLDVTHWWDISMSIRQEAFLNYAYGPTDPATLAVRINFTTPELKRLCKSQKIRSTLYGSFSLFGLAFIFLVGGCLVLTSYLLEPVSKYLFKRKGCKIYQHLEWTTNATLQLQRLAHEEAGFGTWSSCTGTVPSTETNELLGSLDITNLKHPIIKRSNLQDNQNSVQSPVQTEVALSRTVTSSSTPLPVKPVASPAESIDLPKRYRLTLNLETPEIVVEPLGDDTSV
ncbi:hypothetical protein F4680DRAFT_466641 [Xylaria scruposa]|nr:hypothetical protein F4680DRAFT_466641 [Xylaria scruposa]